MARSLDDPTGAASPPTVRADLEAAHQRAWARIARPGAWWRGEERVALASQARAAVSCALCRRRREALSPWALPGAHEASGPLSAAAVDAAHRIASDAARLSPRWVSALRAEGLADAACVELVGVVATAVSLDAFRRALGLPVAPLPDPEPGEPSRTTPPGPLRHEAWLPFPARLPPDLAAQMGTERPGHVLLALGLVPDEVRGVVDLAEAQYLGPRDMLRLDGSPRALARDQIELLAGRVSALRECFY